MPIWSAATISRFQGEGEQGVARSLRCLIARTSLDIVAATATYDLPDDLIYIRRLTWLGRKIDPMPQLQSQAFLDLGIRTGARPDYYIFNQQGRNKITFYPIPNTSIADIDTNLFGSEIASRVIVEYWQLPDSDTVLIPAYIRRRLLKYYVLERCFSIEGKGQNLKNARKMEERFNFYMDAFRKIHAGHFVAKIHALNHPVSARDLNPMARLSNDFGVSGEF